MEYGEYGTVSVYRKFDVFYIFEDFDIYVNNEKYDVIYVKEKKEIQLPIGEYTIGLGINNRIRSDKIHVVLKKEEKITLTCGAWFLKSFYLLLIMTFIIGSKNYTIGMLMPVVFTSIVVYTRYLKKKSIRLKEEK